MDKHSSRLSYQSPKIKVVNIMAEKVLCTSPITVSNPFSGNTEQTW